MDNINPPELLRHLDKESEVLTEAHQSILNELRRLQVEEEMLMRTFHNLLSSQGLIKKRETTEQGSEERHTQATEGSLAFSEEEDFAAMRIEMDTQQRQASKALITASQEDDTLVLKGHQPETDHNRASLEFVAVGEKGGVWSSEKRFEVNDNQTSQALITASCNVESFVPCKND